MGVSENIYKAVLHSMEHGYVFITPDGAVASFNPAACRILGQSADQLAGRSVYDSEWNAIREDGSPFPRKLYPIIVSLKSGTPCFGVVLGLRHGADRLRWLLINSDVVRDEGSNDVLGAVASFADITAQISHKRYLENTLKEVDAASRTVAENMNYLTGALKALAGDIAESNARTIESIGAKGGPALAHAEIVAQKTERLSKLLAKANANAA